MGGNKRRGAFTLIEVLIVVVIMAVLAATIIPQFTSSTADAKLSTAKFNLHTLRSQMELYKLHHNSLYPLSAAALTNALTTSTNALGVTGTGTAFPYGPYIREIPTNPFNEDATIREDAGTNPTIDPTLSTPGKGWLYRPATGQIFVDDGVNCAGL